MGIKEIGFLLIGVSITGSILFNMDAPWAKAPKHMKRKEQNM
jgi:hypothetical protein